MADIFLSYAEQDRARARRVAEVLSAIGWVVWWDRRIPAGQTWRQVLDTELKRMRCMVVLWSRRSIASEWVCEEAAEGRKLGKLLPVLIDAVQPPVGFREVQAADLIGWDGSRDATSMRDLVQDLERLLGKPRPREEPVPIVEESHAQQRWKAGAIGAVMAVGVAASVWVAQRIGIPPTPSHSEAGKPAANPNPDGTGPAKPTASDIRSPAIPSQPGTTPVARKETTPSTDAIKQQCQRIRERLSAGDSLSEESRTFLLKECSR